MARKKLRNLMVEHNVTTEDLARAIGRSPGTVRNICTPSAPSKVARRLITNFFGVRIFPGIWPQLDADVLEISGPRSAQSSIKPTTKNS